MHHVLRPRDIPETQLSSALSSRPTTHSLPTVIHTDPKLKTQTCEGQQAEREGARNSGFEPDSLTALGSHAIPPLCRCEVSRSYGIPACLSIVNRDLNPTR